MGLLLAALPAFAGEHKDVPKDMKELKDETVMVFSARAVLGFDVFGKEGTKLGDIVDFALDLKEAPRLTHVVVQEGGFLDFGGVERAVPAEAISWTGERYVVSINEEKFRKLDALPDNTRRHLQRQSNVDGIASDFGVEPVEVAGEILLYSDLDSYDVEDADNRQLGFLSDAYLSIDNDITPYLLMVPTDPILDTGIGRRYALPTTKLEDIRNMQMLFDITASNLFGVDFVMPREERAEYTQRGLAFKVDLDE